MTKTLGKGALALLRRIGAKDCRLEYQRPNGGWYYVYRGPYWSYRARPAEVKPLFIRGLLTETYTDVWEVSQAGRELLDQIASMDLTGA